MFFVFLCGGRRGQRHKKNKQVFVFVLLCFSLTPPTPQKHKLRRRSHLVIRPPGHQATNTKTNVCCCCLYGLVAWWPDGLLAWWPCATKLPNHQTKQHGYVLFNGLVAWWPGGLVTPNHQTNTNQEPLGHQATKATKKQVCLFVCCCLRFGGWVA